MAFFSTASKDYTSQIQKLVKPTYTSKYGSVIESNLNDILNNKSFSYNPTGDVMYQMYKDQYSKQAKEASMSAAQASALNTGGFANSYGVTSATNASQQALGQLNERTAELYNAAQTQYQNKLNNMYQKFSTLMGEENRLYGQYRDSVGDYYQDWSQLQTGYDTALNQENFEREFEYRKQRDAELDRQHAEQMAYQRSRDSSSDSQAAAQMAYQKQRDAVADSQWQKQYQAALAAARK